MPLIDITRPPGALTDGQRMERADELTSVLLRARRAPDTEFFRGITLDYIQRRDAAGS